MLSNARKILEKIKDRSENLNKERIMAHNKKCFKLHFDDGEGEIFVYPHECKNHTTEDEKVGYVYQGLYQGPDLLGVRVYESKKVEVEEFKELHHIKSKSGKDLFSLDELVEFDYERTGGKIWKQERAKISQRSNVIKATKSVIKDMITSVHE